MLFRGHSKVIHSCHRDMIRSLYNMCKMFLYHFLRWRNNICIHLSNYDLMSFETITCHLKVTLLSFQLIICHACLKWMNGLGMTSKRHCRGLYIVNYSSILPSMMIWNTPSSFLLTCQQSLPSACILLLFYFSSLSSVHPALRSTLPVPLPLSPDL